MAPTKTRVPRKKKITRDSRSRTSKKTTSATTTPAASKVNSNSSSTNSVKTNSSSTTNNSATSSVKTPTSSIASKINTTSSTINSKITNPALNISKNISTKINKNSSVSNAINKNNNITKLDTVNNSNSNIANSISKNNSINKNISILTNLSGLYKNAPSLKDTTKLVIRGKLKAKDGKSSLAGFSVQIEGEKKVSFNSKEISKPVKTRASVEGSTGLFLIELIGKSLFEDNFTLKVISPRGEIIFGDYYTKKELESEINNLPEIDVLSHEISEAKEIKPEFQTFKGQIISNGCSSVMAYKQLVFWAKIQGETDFNPIFTVKSDRNGNFIGRVEDKLFDEVYGVLTCHPDIQVPIKLEGEGRLPKKILLVGDFQENKSEDDCSCNKNSGGVPRLPDDEELVNQSETYSDDLGGGCHSFTAPNRTLEEFPFYYLVRTTEPDIKGLTIEDDGDADVTNSNSNSKSTSEKISRLSARDISSIAVSGGVSDKKIDRLAMRKDLLNISNKARMIRKSVSGRSELSSSNNIDWDDEPTFYQASTLAFGHILKFKQVWKADGYSLGDLLSSIPLAPGQKKQIAVLDWSRSDTASRSEISEQSEELTNSLSRDRAITEIVNSTITESTKGGSKATTWGVGAGVGIAAGPAIIGVAGGAGGGSSKAWQDSSRNLSGDSLQQVKDNTMQAASSYRSQRATVVQTVSQNERVTATTETIANYNHCHAITIQHFEVLRHFQVSQELEDVQECIFVPLMMSPFDGGKVLRWKELLRRRLRDRRLRKAFEAIENVEYDFEDSDLPTGKYCEETVEDIWGDLSVMISIPPIEFPPESEAAKEAGKPIGVDPISYIVAEIANKKIESIEAARERDKEALRKYYEEIIAPMAAEKFINSLKFEASINGKFRTIPLDATLIDRYKEGRTLNVSIQRDGSLGGFSREDLEEIRISTTLKMPDNCKVVIMRANLKYRTDYMRESLARDYRLRDDIGKGDYVIVDTPLNAREKRNPRKEQEELARKLLIHLNSHIEYYHKMIWWMMDDDRRYMLLDGFIVPETNGKSIASVVENRLLGIVGNSLVMPVTRGINLDPSIREENGNVLDLNNLYTPQKEIRPMRISVPTSGVFAESVMGSCNSCEVKDDSRFWRWEESPLPDSPTMINPLDTSSRNVSPGNLQAKDFAQPMINIQNAPSIPDPTGLGTALSTVAQAGAFKDITGLEMNQKNAAAAMQSAMSTAQAFGSMGMDWGKFRAEKAIEMQKTKAGMIQEARRNNLIDEPTAQSMMRDLLSQGVPNIESSTALDNPIVQEVLSREGLNNVELQTPAGEIIRASSRDGSGTSTNSTSNQEDLDEEGTGGGNGDDDDGIANSGDDEETNGNSSEEFQDEYDELTEERESRLVNGNS